MDSHFHHDASHYHKPLDQVLVTSFFGSVSRVQQTPAIKDTIGDIQDFQQLAASESMDPRTCDDVSETVATAAAQAVEAGREDAEVADGPVGSLPGGLAGLQVYFGMLALVVLIGVVTTVR